MPGEGVKHQAPAATPWMWRAKEVWGSTGRAFLQQQLLQEEPPPLAVPAPGREPRARPRAQGAGAWAVRAQLWPCGEQSSEKRDLGHANGGLPGILHSC